MPAVELERLKTEIARLSWQFTRPEEFHRQLNDLLEYYSNQGYRAGSNITSAKFIQVYHLPPQIVSQLERQLGQLCSENPIAALTLADELWKDNHIETRRLAAFMLGQAPLVSPSGILERLAAWCNPEEESMSLDVLLKYGSWRLRHEQPDSWLDVIQGWLEKDSFPYIKLGLQALIPVLEDREFNNLPPIYRLLLPLLSAPQPALISDLQNVIIALEQRSSGETAYFLRQIIYRNPIPDVLRLVRRVLPLLSSDTQKNLHDVVKEFSIPE